MVTLLSVLPKILIIINEIDQTDAENKTKKCPISIEEYTGSITTIVPIKPNIIAIILLIPTISFKKMC